MKILLILILVGGAWLGVMIGLGIYPAFNEPVKDWVDNTMPGLNLPVVAEVICQQYSWIMLVFVIVIPIAVLSYSINRLMAGNE